MAKFLVVTWDGAGNLTAALGMARGLVARGHDVRFLGHRTVGERCEAGGWRFRSFTHTANLDSSVAFPTESEELAFMVGELMMSANVARDVADELGREPADALVADSMLLGALSVGEAQRVPTVALFSTAFSILRAGPFVDALTPSIGSLNDARTSLGVPAVGSLSDVHDACSLCVVTSLMEFEPVNAFPSNVRFVGPFVDAPALLRAHRDPGLSRRTDCRVVVSFSTGGQRQLEPLQRVVDALGELPAEVLVTTGSAVDPRSIRAWSNTRVVDFVPHQLVMPGASLVVTHAGLGTVMKACAFGVPLVCMPMGRDQFFNAARVEALGAGVTVNADADADTVRDTVRAALDNRSLSANAQHLAGLVATYQGESGAAIRVEQLVSGG
jgi:UDP:flavonoid glycosyltransferase YjiC (YdhE family)